jgi:type IV pilus assembly protein PilA
LESRGAFHFKDIRKDLLTMTHLYSPLLKRRGSEGFTLVELMVVVAIIGILAAIAIPNYQKYQARARQSEAKVNLAASYTAEQAFYTEQGTYSGCLYNIGFNMLDNTSATSKLYYAVGFDDISATTCGPTAGTGCNSYQWTQVGVVLSTCAYGANTAFFNAAAKVHIGTAAAAVGANLTNSDVNQSGFNVEAAGGISATSSAYDYWLIDSNKFLRNTTQTL